MKSIVFYNPHVDDFLAEPIHFKILRRRPLKKYGFMFEQAIAAKNKINIFYDQTSSGIIPEYIFKKLPKTFRSLLSFLEIRIWIKLNNLTDDIVIVNPSDTSLNNKILISFSYKSAVGLFNERIKNLKQFEKVVFHLSHYFISTSVKSENMAKLDNIVLAGDSDFTKNDYFKTYFSWYKKKFLVLPFSVSNRFHSKKDFMNRLHKIIATGSFHNLEKEPNNHLYNDFLNTFKVNTYHPIRKNIFESRKKLNGIIDSKISPYRDYNKGRLKTLISYFNIAQKSYFSIDIVDLYNQYKFAIVGEEISGAPALGALEAMACGCVVFANSEYMHGLGFVSGKDYIQYDGTLESLLNIFNDINTFAIDEIAFSGMKIINDQYTPPKVYKRWLDSLSNLN